MGCIPRTDAQPREVRTVCDQIQRQATTMGASVITIMDALKVR